MRLVASLIIRNELGRYLAPCIAHLLEFCDSVYILDNGSTDGWRETLSPDKRVTVWTDVAALGQTGSMFVDHAAARQHLCELTVSRSPDWVLAIDADEFIADGAALRAACERADRAVLAVCLQEVWGADPEHLRLRQDGGWVEHDVGLLWRPALVPPPHQIADRGPATGRTPENVGRVPRGHACTALLHFGWVNEAEREDRHHRYAVADGGRYHNAHHLDSILWPDERVALTATSWPEALHSHREAILAATRPKTRAAD